MKKKILGLLLAVCMVISLLPMTAMAAGPSAVQVNFLTGTGTNTAEGQYYTRIQWDVAANETYYALADENGVLSDLGKLAQEPAAWTVKLDNTEETAKLVLNGGKILRNNFRYASSATSNPALPDNWKRANTGTISVFGSGALEIVVAADTELVQEGASASYQGIAVNMTGGTTVTSENNAKLTFTINSSGLTRALSAIGGDLTIKDANIATINTDCVSTTGPWATISAAANLLIDNSTLDIKLTDQVNPDGTIGFSNFSGTAINVTGNLTVQNGSNLTLSQTASEWNDFKEQCAITVAGTDFVFNGSNMEIYTILATVKGGTATGYNWDYLINKMPTTMTCVEATYSESHEGTNLQTLNPTDPTVGVAYPYVKFTAAHTFDGDCTTADKCANCDAVATAANAHVFDNDCTTADKCANCETLATASTGHTATATQTDCAVAVPCENPGCQKNAYEAKAHTPKAGTYACDVAHPCDVCNGNYREAGVHVGGGTEATCQKKAVCSCGQEYGELAACKPEADDGDCTTAVKCSVCGKECTAAQTAHKYTNTADASCDNAGCTHTRIVEDGDKNPQTGDATPIVLFAVLVAAAFVCIVCTKKRAI